MKKLKNTQRRRQGKLKVNVDAAGKLLMTLDRVRQLYAPPQTMGMADKDTCLALDEAIGSNMSLLHQSIGMMGADAFPRFLGYGYLIMLAQDGLIRAGISMLAKEMTSKWVTLQRRGGNSQKDSVEKLTQEIERFKIKKLFKDAADNCGYFGGCLIFIDTGETGGALVTPLKLDPATMPQGTVKGFRIVEPFNVSPGLYNASNPLAANYYKPSTWFVQGQQIHASRFLYFVQNELPSMLLPTYNFFGIPLAQLVLDAVNHFSECREAEARLLMKFSLTVLKTDMSEILSGGAGGELSKRVQFLVQNRSNDGVEVIDKENEDIVNVTTPLSGVTDIVRQSMEMVAAYFNEPCTKMWGISPAGMNATGESDMKNHYAHIGSLQEECFREPLEKLLKILQLNVFGSIDDTIFIKFNELSDEDENKTAATQKVRAETDTIYLNGGAVSPEEVRKKIAQDPKSGYNNIDPDELPEIPEEVGEEHGGELKTSGVAENGEIVAGGGQ